MNADPSILVVTQPGGGESSQTPPLLELLAERATVSVLTAGSADDMETPDGVGVELYSGENTADGLVSAGVQFGANQARMCRAIVSSDADVIWFYGANLYTLPVAAAKATAATVVTQPKGDVPRAIYQNADVPEPIGRAVRGLLRACERASYAASDAVVTYTEGMAETYNTPAEKTLPYGARFVDGLAVQTPIDERPARAGFLGRLEPSKNALVAAAVGEKSETPVVIGGDGSQAAAIADRAAETAGLTYAGWVTDVEAFLNSIQVLVLPCTPTEGLPTVIMEAYACGTPVLTTPVSGNRDVVIPGDTGAFVVNADPDHIASRLDALIQTDLTALSAAARRLYEQTFTREAASERYGHLLAAIGAGEDTRQRVGSQPSAPGKLIGGLNQ